MSLENIVLEALPHRVAVSCDLLEPAEEIAVLSRQLRCFASRQPFVVGHLETSGHIEDH